MGIPLEAAEMRGKVQFLAVIVTPDDGTESWQVMRCFDDFHDLHGKLGPGCDEFRDAPYPPKGWVHSWSGPLDDRRRGLECWLQRSIEHPLSYTHWHMPLKDFLEAGRHALAAAPVAAVAPAPPPVASAPPPSAPAAESNEVGEEMCIEIPEGVVGGQVIGIVVPSGEQKEVTVPTGMKAGQELHLWYDTAAGTLTVM
eukprot:NODE_3405_length_791_cov_164.430707.p1 GENE.NODE_3405_length_791_cov_164.430707~~NODE_3405_length_791_cov_164.430707.p1  ORF type:complete len:198 (+),score=76.59 NODE_3405_length_791_cov_164.430707:3-596(+)